MQVKIEMNMPRSCDVCPLCAELREFDATYVTPTCVLLEQDVGDFITERHKDCPLKECK